MRLNVFLWSIAAELEPSVPAPSFNKRSSKCLEKQSSVQWLTMIVPCSWELGNPWSCALCSWSESQSGTSQGCCSMKVKYVFIFDQFWSIYILTFCGKATPLQGCVVSFVSRGLARGEVFTDASILGFCIPLWCWSGPFLTRDLQVLDGVGKWRGVMVAGTCLADWRALASLMLIQCVTRLIFSAKSDSPKPHSGFREMQ